MFKNASVLLLIILGLMGHPKPAHAQIVSAPTLVGRLNDVKEVYFETNLAIGSIADDLSESGTETRIWIKVTPSGDYQRTEYIGNLGVAKVVIRPDGIYKSMTPLGALVKQEPRSQEIVNLLMTLHMEGMLAQKVLNVKEEDLNGERVIVMRSSEKMGEFEIIDTFWISKITNFPVKHRRETLLNGTSTMLTVETYKNVSLKEVPMSVFDVPGG